MFEGNPGDLEFFYKTYGSDCPTIDKATTNYILRHFYSRISLDILTDIGASCDTSWEEVNKLLREKFGGVAHSIPKLVARELLKLRSNSEVQMA